MNRKIFIFSIVLFFAFFSGCDDNKNSKDPESLRIAKDLESIAFNEKSNEGVIGVLSNIPWTLTVQNGGSWLTCTPASGNGSESVIVSATANTDPPVRSATITIASQNGAFSHTVTVSQLGTEPNILVSPTSVNVLDEGEEITVTVTATNTFTIDKPAWVSEGSRDGNKIVFVVEANEGDEEREGIITFSLNASDKQASLTITQPHIPYVTPVVNHPSQAAVGTNVNLTGTDLLLITEVWFGTVKGVIVEEGRTDASMIVTVPADAPQDEVDLKIFYGDKGRSAVVGQITLLSPQPVVNALAERVTIGGMIYLTGTDLDLIEEVWFGSAKGEIVAGGTAVLVKVTVPVGTTPGTTEVKITFGGTQSKTAGNIELVCPDPSVNLAQFAGSLLPGVPKLLFSGNSSGTWNASGGRWAINAFDGCIDGPTWDLIDFETIYGSDKVPTRGRTYWQVNSVSVAAEIPNTGPAPTGNAAPPWASLNYSETKEGSVTFDKIEIIPREDTQLVKKYTIEISEDGNSWTKLIKAEDTEPFPASTSVVVIHQLEQLVTTKYIRFVIVETTNATNNSGLTHFALYNTGSCQ